MSKCCCCRNQVDGDGLNGACACWMGCGTCSVLEAVVVVAVVVEVSLSMTSKLRYRGVGRRDCLFHSGYLFRTFFTKREKTLILKYSFYISSKSMLYRKLCLKSSITSYCIWNFLGCFWEGNHPSMTLERFWQLSPNLYLRKSFCYLERVPLVEVGEVAHPLVFLSSYPLSSKELNNICRM